MGSLLYLSRPPWIQLSSVWAQGSALWSSLQDWGLNQSLSTSSSSINSSMSLQLSLVISVVITCAPGSRKHCNLACLRIHSSGGVRRLGTWLGSWRETLFLKKHSPGNSVVPLPVCSQTHKLRRFLTKNKNHLARKTFTLYRKAESRKTMLPWGQIYLHLPYN